MSTKTTAEARATRRRRIRGKVVGTAARPRLVGLSLQQGDLRPGDRRRHRHDAGGGALGRSRRRRSHKTGVAKKVGELLAERARAKDIAAVVFDRSGYLYHGRVKALAEGAREGGLVF